MAIDMAESAAAPIFYYGAEYGGAFEPCLLSVVNRVFEPSTRVYRATMIGFLLGTVLGLWQAARVAGGRRVGALVGICAALSPAYLYYKSLTSDGAYASLTFFGVMTLLLTVELERRLEEGLPVGRTAAALGGACGLAFWIHLAALPYLAAALAAGLSWLVSRRLGVRESLLAAGGFLAGSLPWWIRNAETGFASLTQGEVSFSDPASLAGRVSSLVTESLPVVFGPSSFRGPPVPSWIGALIAANLVAVLLLAWRAAGQKAPTVLRRLYLSSFVLIGASGASYLAARIARPREPRYLLPSLIGFIVLTGLLLASASRRPRPLLAVGIVPFVLAIASHVRAPRLRDFQRTTSDRPKGREMLFADAEAVLKELSSRGIHSIYGSYWTVYRLVFLSSRTLAGAPFGRISVDRMPGLTRRAHFDPAPAFLLDGADLRDMDDFLARRRLSVDRVRIGGLVLFSRLPSEAVVELRAANRVPVE